jgi:hypothetical protein
MLAKPGDRVLHLLVESTTHDAAKGHRRFPGGIAVLQVIPDIAGQERQCLALPERPERADP